MGRLPFDPLQTAAAKATSPAPTTLTVSQVAARIGGALNAGLPEALRFVGEVSGFRDRTHWYFDLKDQSAVVNCVCFQSAAKKMGFVPANGQQVLARGRVEFYAPSGKVSILIEKLEPVGAGALDIAYRALCDELRLLGWFDPSRKRPLPFFPRRIAIVTSRTGAALQDVLVTMQRRCPAVAIYIVDVRVQGPGASGEIAAAVRALSAVAQERGIDAIMVTRGGGSMEDLWAFNDRDLARAILDASVPVVAAIGHETDTTIAELVADERCATPTQAAMRLTPDANALALQIAVLARRLGGIIRRRIDQESRHLEGLRQRPMFTRAAAALEMPAQSLLAVQRAGAAAIGGRLMAARHSLSSLVARLESRRPALLQVQRKGALTLASSRLQAAMRQVLGEAWAALDASGRQLSAVGPMQVLARGYSLTMSQGGAIVRSPSQVASGDLLRTRLAEGEVMSVVGNSKAAPALGSTPIPRAKPRRRRDEGPTLF